MVELLGRIASEIVLSQNAGAVLKKWREIFGITQTELAEHLKITPSTVSDYEGNRRKSPGISVIRRFISALYDIDQKKGGWVAKKFEFPKKSEAYQLFEFSEPRKSMNFVKKIDGKIASNEDILKDQRIYGCTLIDSMRAIMELPGDEFIKIYGSTTERTLVFTNVSLGRSPMVAIRVTKLKPSFVVLHNVAEVDKLALKISELEKIPLVTTMLPLEELKNRMLEPEK